MQMLMALDAAARHGSYSAAAAELGLTHGAISHQIRDLEAQLAIPLFRRDGRSMVPTREAVTLLAQVRQALGTLHQAFPGRRAAASGRVIVGIHPSLANCWLIPRIGDFIEANPKVTIEIRSTADLGDFLAPGIDIAIRYGLGTWPNVASERIGDERQFPIAAADYRQRLEIETPSDLSRCTLLRHAWQPWTPWLRAARVRLQEPETAFVMSDTSMLVEAAAAGLGVALVRERFVTNAVAMGRVVRLFDVALPDTNGYYLASRPGEELSQACVEFRAWLRKEMELEP